MYKGKLKTQYIDCEDSLKLEIFGLQKLSLVDFPDKTACTVFTGGCNFRCPFCHNASLVTGLNEIETISHDDFFSFLEKRKNILDGVCITGGEPLLNKDILNFIEKIKEKGYPIKLDTNGSFPQRLREIVDSGLIDYVAMDIKGAPESYSAVCGTQVNLADINESIEFLLSDRIDYEFRTTVMKEFHDAICFSRIGEWIKGAKRYFIQSFTDSGDILCGTFTPYSPEELAHFASIVEPFVLQVQLRGV